MHDGRFEKLKDVIAYYNEGLDTLSFSDPRLSSSMALSPNEQVDLMAFLMTLNDTDFIFNKDFAYPRALYNEFFK